MSVPVSFRARTFRNLSHNTGDVEWPSRKLTTTSMCIRESGQRLLILQCKGSTSDFRRMDRLSMSPKEY